MSKMIVLAWSDCDDAIPPWSHLEGTTFWQSRRVKCACCDCFFPCCMNVSTVEQWSQKMSLGGLTEQIGTMQKMSLAASRNESERRAIWTCQIGGSCFLRNRAKFYWTQLHHHAPLFVQNRFVMYITRCTGTSVLCISTVYVPYIARIILLTQLQYSFVCAESIYRFVMYITCCIRKSIMMGATLPPEKWWMRESGMFVTELCI